VIFVVVFVVVYARAVGGLILFGTNSLGLIMLASKSSEEHTLNPFSENVSFISPDAAEWILVSFDWPYRGNQASAEGNSERVPEVHFTISMRGVFSDAPEVDERRMRLISNFIRRGASLEERSLGLTALHEAVISADVVAIPLLVRSGADVSARVKRPERRHDGKTAAEFAELLYGEDSKVSRALAAAVSDDRS